MHMLLSNEYRKLVAESNYTYIPNRVVTFPRHQHEHLMQVEREENRKIIRYGKGYSKDCYRMMAYFYAMRIEFEEDNVLKAFVCGDSKKEIGALAGIEERNAQKIIKVLIENDFIEEYLYRQDHQVYKGYLICNYYKGYTKGNGGCFKLPSEVWSSDFWKALSKPATKLYFQQLSEIQAQGGNPFKIKDTKDLEKLLHYKSSNKLESIVSELKSYFQIFETDKIKKGVTGWIISLHRTMENIKTLASKINKTTSFITKKIKKDTRDIILGYKLPCESEKTLIDYCHAMKKYGAELFEYGAMALVQSCDHIQTTPIQKFYGIIKNLAKEPIEKLRDEYQPFVKHPTLKFYNGK